MKEKKEGWRSAVMILRVDHLSTTIKKKAIIKEIDCNFENGVHGLLGPNGAGKTTFMRSILGLYPQAKGKIMLDDTILPKTFVGYLPQKFGLFPNMTVRQALTYIGNLKNMSSDILRDDIEKLISDMNLDEKLDEKMSSLSGGMVRRVGIVQAFLGNPSVVVLDEPTAGLDPEERLRFKKYIKNKKEKQIIIISTHIVDDIEYLADYVEIMQEGKIIAQGTREDISRCAEHKVFGVTKEELDNISSTYYMVKDYEDQETKKVRILLNDRCYGKELAPNLEDGYLCLLKKV